MLWHGLRINYFKLYYYIVDMLMLMSVLIVSILFTFYLYLIFFSSLYQKKFISTCYEIRIIHQWKHNTPF